VRETILAPIEIDPTTFLRKHCPLPALPEVVHEIQNVIQSQDVDLNRVAYLISGEPALVAQVLKVVNSAYYGFPQEISNVKYAIAFLGLNEIYRMVLSLSVINTIAITQKEELVDFWFHSFYSALCTKYLAKRYKSHLSFEEFWASAILHDIGKLVYLKFFPDHYSALNSYCKEQGCLFTEAERHFSLPASAYLGTILCDRWRLPGKIRRACECHALSDLFIAEADHAQEPFDRMITLGNLCALLSTNGLHTETRKELGEAVRKALELSEETFLLIMGDIFELKIHAQKFLDELN
jgi:HD-like signal output (HDOD) protein